MTGPTTWPSRWNEATPTLETTGQDPHTQAVPVPAHALISEMTDLLRDTRVNLLADGCLLGGIAIGMGIEAAGASPAPLSGMAGFFNLALLCATVICWLAAACVLGWASRPVLNTLSELRWVTGAPLDPRPGWLALPPTGADPAEWTWQRAHVLLGAARLAQYRLQFANTWGYLAGACLLAWTAARVLGLSDLPGTPGGALG
jgi:hypothetical protein